MESLIHKQPTEKEVNMKLKKIVFILFCVSIVNPIFAQEVNESTFPVMRPIAQNSEYKPHVGLLFGAAVAEGNGSTSSEVGIDIGYQPYIPFGLAAEYSFSQVGADKKSQDRNSFWAKGTYNFGGTIPLIMDSYVGLGLGAVLKNDGTSFAAAPLIGFDIPIKIESTTISIGAASRYAIVSDGDLDTFLVSGVVKFWY